MGINIDWESLLNVLTKWLWFSFSKKKKKKLYRCRNTIVKWQTTNLQSILLLTKVKNGKSYQQSLWVIDLWLPFIRNECHSINIIRQFFSHRANIGVQCWSGGFHLSNYVNKFLKWNVYVSAGITPAHHKIDSCCGYRTKIVLYLRLMALHSRIRVSPSVIVYFYGTDERTQLLAMDNWHLEKVTIFEKCFVCLKQTSCLVRRVLPFLLLWLYKSNVHIT